jgi:hypothetical protein
MGCFIGVCRKKSRKSPKFSTVIPLIANVIKGEAHLILGNCEYFFRAKALKLGRGTPQNINLMVELKSVVRIRGCPLFTVYGE